PIHPSAARAVSFWVPPRSRAWANGLVTGSALLGIASAYKLFGLLIDLYGWPSAFIICGVATTALALLWAVYATDRPTEHLSGNAQDRRLIGAGEHLSVATAGSPGLFQLLRHNRSLQLITISYAAVNYFEYLFFHWMEHYFEKVRHQEKEAARDYSTL